MIKSPKHNLMVSLGSWHVLFAVLCEDFESPKMVWNFSTLRHLTECLNAASKELDAERSIR